ncbi:7051_t:CDS:1, partial [Gigaspora rosea]
MTKANEAYLTTKNELANIEINNETEKMVYYFYNFASLVRSEFGLSKLFGPREDDMEIKAIVMARCSIGERYNLQPIIGDELKFHNINVSEMF